MRKAIGLLTSVFFLLFVLLALKPTPAKAQQSEDPVLQLMDAINSHLAGAGANFRLEAIEFYTIGEGRPSRRIHQSGTRWVPEDGIAPFGRRTRWTDGTNLTFLIDQSGGNTASGLVEGQTSPAITSSFTTWQMALCARNFALKPKVDSGIDPDFFDNLLGTSFGNEDPGTGPFAGPLADITHAGWMSKEFFDAIVLGGGNSILSATITFTFPPPLSDINNDGHVDTAWKEIYYNNGFGDPEGPVPTPPWSATASPLVVSDASFVDIDVQTVALHENGHALELGHFGPPPAAVMNDRYSGLRQALTSIDEAGLCTVFGSWPQR